MLKGEQCSHEGGTKKACKRHKVCTFTLLSLTGQPLISATHLAGLAHRLQVSHYALAGGGSWQVFRHPSFPVCPPIVYARQEPLQTAPAPVLPAFFIFTLHWHNTALWSFTSCQCGQQACTV